MVDTDQDGTTPPDPRLCAHDWRPYFTPADYVVLLDHRVRRQRRRTPAWRCEHCDLRTTLLMKVPA